MGTDLFKDFVRLIMAAVTVLVVFTIGLWLWGNWKYDWDTANAMAYGQVSDGRCNVAVVPLVGEIVGYTVAPPSGMADEGEMPADAASVADEVIEKIRRATYDPNIKAIIMQIDSGGGWPVASYAIADAIKKSPIPVVALVRDTAASGAYIVASAAETIVAHPSSIVGSIGVTMSYLDYTDKNTKDGIKYVALSSAPYKDAGAPGKPLTAQERELFERDLKASHEQFVQTVADNRKMSVEEVAALADGSAMVGTMAREKKLVDLLGNEDTALGYLANKLGLVKDELITCFPL